MRGRNWSDALMLGLAFALSAGISPQASAQTAPTVIPVPRPAPFAKEGVLPPASVPTAPMAITPAPATQPAPPKTVQPTVPPSGPAPAIAGIQPTPRGATAFDGIQRAALERVNTYLNGISTLVGAFVQLGPDGTRTDGQFYLQKPGKVRFEYNPPSPIELIADGSAVAVRDRKLVTQDIYPLSQTPLRFLLADKVDLLRDSNVVGIYQDELFITVVIEEKSAVAGTHRLMIMFGVQDNQLKQWTVTDPQGYDTTIAVYNLDTSQKPDPKLFRINYERILQ